MFLHIYKSRLKCILRDRQVLFWVLVFPIVLATLFKLTIANINSGEEFEPISVAVIENEAFKEDTMFSSALEAVSEDDENRLFVISYVTAEEAEELLKQGAVSGVIKCGDEISLDVRSSGLNPTIIKAFLDDYIRTFSTVEAIIQEDPLAINNGLFEKLYNREEYLKEVAPGRDSPDTAVYYFYTVIAMTCLYGSFHGLKEVSAAQANQSAQGARVSIAPTHKLKVFSVSMLSAFTVQFAVVLILLVFLRFALGIDFGDRIPLLILSCAVGTFTGITFGTLVSALVKGREGLKEGILVGSSMIMCFFAGMMYIGMKNIIARNVPILGWINPANLISDTFYSLYFYERLDRFSFNIIVLFLLGIVFSAGTYFVLRRQRYASI